MPRSGPQSKRCPRKCALHCLCRIDIGTRSCRHLLRFDVKTVVAFRGVPLPDVSVLRLSTTAASSFAQKILGGHRPPVQPGASTVGALYERPPSICCAEPPNQEFSQSSA